MASEEARISKHKNARVRCSSGARSLRHRQQMHADSPCANVSVKNSDERARGRSRCFGRVVTQLSCQLRKLNRLVARVARKQKTISGLDHVGEPHKEQAIYAKDACHPFANYFRSLAHVRKAGNDKAPICNGPPKMCGFSVSSEERNKFRPRPAGHLRKYEKRSAIQQAAAL